MKGKATFKTTNLDSIDDLPYFKSMSVKKMFICAKCKVIKAVGGGCHISFMQFLSRKKVLLPFHTNVKHSWPRQLLKMMCRLQ